MVLFHWLTLPGLGVLPHLWPAARGWGLWLAEATEDPPSLLSSLGGGDLGAFLCLRVAEECTCFHWFPGDNEVLKKSSFSFSL